jgi:hypothetical protein
VTIQFIGGGFGRTGSHSLAQALEILGFGPCYHMDAFQRHDEHLPFWQAALARKPVDWDALFQTYRSVVEWPAVAFLPQILSAFPRAKVILTLRDPESWYQSAREKIFKGLALGERNPNPKNAARAAFNRRLILKHTFAGKHKEKETAIQIYLDHIRMVRELVPAGRLLAFDVRAGWEPLCAFLGVPAPPHDFPHQNERKAFLAQAPAWFKKLVEEMENEKQD